MFSSSWHWPIESAVDRNPTAATFVRVNGAVDGNGDPIDLEVTLDIAAMQFQERTVQTAGTAVQTSRRWMVPARRLAASGFPVPSVGDGLRIPALGVDTIVQTVSPGFAGGEVVRWDITEAGV